MKAILVGATGLVGSEVLKRLLEDPDYSEVVVYARRSPGIEHPRLRIVIGELNEMNNHSAELKGDIYFSCLGTTIKTAGSEENFRKVDYHAVVNFGRLAASLKAKKLLIVSASGAHSQSSIFYSRVKGEAEKALKDMTLPGLVIFRPGLLIGDRTEKRTFENVGVQGFRILRHILPVKLTKSIGTEVSVLADHMVTEGKNPTPGLKIIDPKEI